MTTTDARTDRAAEIAVSAVTAALQPDYTQAGAARIAEVAVTAILAAGVHITDAVPQMAEAARRDVDAAMSARDVSVRQRRLASLALAIAELYAPRSVREQLDRIPR